MDRSTEVFPSTPAAVSSVFTPTITKLLTRALSTHTSPKRRVHRRRSATPLALFHRASKIQELSRPLLRQLDFRRAPSKFQCVLTLSLLERRRRREQPLAAPSRVSRHRQRHRPIFAAPRSLARASRQVSGLARCRSTRPARSSVDIPTITRP